MAAPNIINTTAIYGKTATVSLTTTNVTSVLSNAASSGKVLKVNTLIVSNVDGANPYSVTVSYHSAAAAGGTATEIASTITVPAKASLVVIDKSWPVYLEEDKSLSAAAGTASKLKVVCSYEEIA